MSRATEVYAQFLEDLQPADEVCQAEYRLLVEHLKELGPIEPQTAVSSLREIAAWADGLANRLDDRLAAAEEA